MIYVIYEMREVAKIDFSEIIQTSESTLRISVDGEKTVLKFAGETPSFLVGVEQFNHSEILEIMSTPEWTSETERITK